MSHAIDYADIPSPGPWIADALCKGRTAEFFDQHHPVPRSIRETCAACPVRAQCLSYALENDVRGIWAGTNWTDRERLRRRCG